MNADFEEKVETMAKEALSKYKLLKKVSKIKYMSISDSNRYRLSTVRSASNVTCSSHASMIEELRHSIKCIAYFRLFEKSQPFEMTVNFYTGISDIPEYMRPDKEDQSVSCLKQPFK